MIQIFLTYINYIKVGHNLERFGYVSLLNPYVKYNTAAFFYGNVKTRKHKHKIHSRNNNRLNR